MSVANGIFEEARRFIADPPGQADVIEVVMASERAATLRFANSVFHQGMDESDSSVYVRVIIGRKIGVASTNRFDADSLRRCFEKACHIAGLSGEEPFDLKLPGPASYAEIKSHFASTAGARIGDAVDAISASFRKASTKGVLQSGFLSLKEGEVAVLNTNGVSARHPYTVAELSSVSTVDGASGIRGAVSKDLSLIDIGSVMEDSMERCLMARSPKAVGPGVYRVLFEPAAVVELLQWLSYLGFGAKNFHEGTSFLCGKIGKRITGKNVTIYDDGIDPRGLSMPFDMTGAPKRKVVLIEKGVARGVVYDSLTASIDGRASTGHAPYPDDTEGPLPAHLFMEGGSSGRGDLIKRLDKGLLVSSFHYVNGLLNPSETLMTGMTRHGTFYVEGGVIRHPVSPLRFTENILSAFSRMEDASTEVEVFPDGGASLGSITAPHVLIDGFRFTS